MTNKNYQRDNNKNPREIPTKKDPEKIIPDKAPDLTPDESNPINPETDEPKGPKDA